MSPPTIGSAARVDPQQRLDIDATRGGAARERTGPGSRSRQRRIRRVAHVSAPAGLDRSCRPAGKEARDLDGATDNDFDGIMITNTGTSSIYHGQIDGFTVRTLFDDPASASGPGSVSLGAVSFGIPVQESVSTLTSIGPHAPVRPDRRRLGFVHRELRRPAGSGAGEGAAAGTRSRGPRRQPESSLEKTTTRGERRDDRQYERPDSLPRVGAFSFLRCRLTRASNACHRNGP